MPKISDLPTDTAPDSADLIPFVDVDAARTESVTVANLAASAAFSGQYAPLSRLAPLRTDGAPFPLGVTGDYPAIGSAPTRTLGTGASPGRPTSTITSAVDFSLGTPGWFLLQNGIALTALSAPDDAYYAPTHNVAGLVGGGYAFAFEFMFDGSEFEVEYESRGTGFDWRLIVDGELAGTYTMSTNNTKFLDNIDFTTRAVRHIRIEMPYGFTHGIKVGPNDTVYPPPQKRRPVVAWFGDSFSTPLGSNGATDFDTVAWRTGRLGGWDVVTVANTGAGYATAGTVETTVTSITTNLANINPDVVVIASGRNDNTETAATVQAAAEAAYDLVAAQSVPLIVVGAWPSDNPESAGVDTANDGIIAAVAAAGSIVDLFIDPITDGWITGTGRVGSTTGTGNADLYVSSDGVHPSDAGHRYLASRFVAEVRAALALT